MLNLFETPWLLISLSVFLLVAAGICRQIRPEWGYWPVLAAVLAAGAGVGLDYFIQTDTEKIRAIIDTCRDSAMAGTTRGMEPVIADTYSDPVHKSKEALLADGERILSRIAFTAIGIKSHAINVRGSEARSDLRLRVFMDPQRSEYPLAGGLMLVNMALDHRRTADGRWQITHIELISINDASVDWGAAR